MKRAWVLPLSLAALAAAGCFRMHERLGSGDADKADGGPRPSIDAAVADVRAPDGRLDAGLDATVPGDADADAAIPTWDAEPPPPEPPDPSSCRIEPEVHPFNDPVLEYSWPNEDVVHRSSVHVSMTPLVIDLTPEEGEELEPVLVFVSYPPLRSRPEPPGILRIVDPRTDTTVSYPPTADNGGVLEASTNLAAGDIDGDGENEIVGLGRNSGSYAFESDGSLKWSSAYPTARDRGLRAARTIGGAPTLADLEGDGSVEVVIGRNVMDGATGEHRWTGQEGTGRGSNQFLGPISCVADLDGDGVQEVIAGHTAFRADGSIYWNNTDVPDGLCAIADIFGDGKPEVVLSANGWLRVLDGRTGERLWRRQLEGRVRLSLGGAPTVADFDGDDRPEIGVAHGGAYGVYDPECEAPGRPRACTDEGLLWKQRTSDASSSGTGSSVFDFNGDGRAEVIYNDERFFRIYDGVTGEPRFEHRNSSRTRTETPTIADIDNDGNAEIIFCANAEAFFIREHWTEPGVQIWGDRRGRWVGARRIWNQHAYHITNVREDGTIPAAETPSWTKLNAYRQNLREGGDVLSAPDLWGGHGSYECLDGGRMRLQVEVQNWGLERAGAGIAVGFYRDHPRRGEHIGTVYTTSTLAPRGGAERVELETRLRDPAVDYYAVIDDPADEEEGARVNECREGNNTVLIWRPQCP